MAMTVLHLRCAGVAAASGAAAVAVAAVLLPTVIEVTTRIRSGGVEQVGFPELLVAGCAGLALLGVSVCWLGVLVVSVEAWRACPVTGTVTVTGSPRVRGIPTVLRQAVLTACGVAVLGGALPAAAAAPGAGADGPAATTAVLHGLPYPDRAEDHPSRATPASTAAAATTASATSTALRPPSSDQVTVRSGDTLWAIARDRLGDGGAPPSDADVVRAVSRWHHVNHQVIGPEPDLILPGQQLRPPASTEPASTEPANPAPSPARGGPR